MLELVTVSDSTLFDVFALVWLVVVGSVATWLAWDAFDVLRSLRVEIALPAFRSLRRRWRA